ncbi:helix-turn-helix domain-containing protein [Paenibacillus hodogayensis]|uniref:Helix-turn-helix domain-containing protein n=1 Tax=Paenibacillus hodogayensis TaxID=279208 RepID=A0ABV5VSU4_9BACL
MRKNWFYRMLLSYLPVFLAVCVTLLLITFISVRQLSERSAVKSSEAVTKNAVQLVEQSLRNIENTLYATVLADPRLTAFYGDAQPDSHKNTYAAAKALEELEYRLPLLHSAYLYRPQDGTVLGSTSIAEIENATDQAFILAKMSSDIRYAWGDLRPLAAPRGNGEGSRDVISLVKIADLRTNGLIVVNVNVDALRTFLVQSTDTSSAYLELTDAAGVRIVSTIASDGPAAKQERNKLAAAAMPYTGWHVEGGMLQPGLFGWVSPILYGSVSLGALCMALGLAWIVYVTRRHYRPVESLLRQVGALTLKKTPAADTETRDEFKTIGLALDNLWDQSNRLSRENEENRSFKRAHHFRRLAEGRMDPQSKEARREAELLGLKLDGGPASAAIVEIDRYYADVCGRFTDRDRQLLKYALYSAMRETMAAACVNVWADWLGEHQLGIIAAHGDKHGAERGIEEALERLRGWADGQLPFTVTTGLGTPVPHSDRIDLSFQAARSALAYKVPLGRNRLIRFADLPGESQPGVARELQRIKELSRMFRLGEPGWTAEWTALLESLHSGGFTAEQIRHLLFVLLFHVQRELIELPAELQSAWLAASSHLEDALREGETLEEIGEAFAAVFASVEERLREWRESKQSHSVLQEVKRYIDEHYADPGLSQTMLAEAFRLHPTSISRLFKEEFGVKFVEYVNSVRLDRATELMETTDLPVHEIAQAAGFTHSQTFIKMFKKSTGFTPGSYRKGKPETG